MIIRSGFRTKKKVRYDKICLVPIRGLIADDLCNASYFRVNSDDLDDKIEMTQEDIENLKNSKRFREVISVLGDFLGSFGTDSFDIGYVYLTSKKNKKGQIVVDIDSIDCYDRGCCYNFDKEDIEERLWGQMMCLING